MGILPSLCGLCDIPVPRTIEGRDLSRAWQGVSGAFEQGGILTMNSTASYDYLEDLQEWRGVRTKRYSYARWLNGRVELFDLENDPLQMTNLADIPRAAELRHQLEDKLQEPMHARNDQMVPCTSHRDWFDNYRRIVRNVY